MTLLEFMHENPFLVGFLSLLGAVTIVAVTDSLAEIFRKAPKENETDTANSESRDKENEL